MKEHQNLTYIFLHRILNGFADAMIKVFIPLLIYKQTGNLYLSMLYCLISYTLSGVWFIVLQKVITRLPVLCIIVQILPLIVIQFLIGNINVATTIIIAILNSISTTLYYGGLNLLFGLSVEKINTAKYESAEHIGKIFFIALSATLLGEVQNSLIFVTITATIMYILGVMPLVFNYKKLTKNINITSNLKPLEILKDTKYYNYYHICFAALQIFTTVFLPLYIYSNGISFTATGLMLVLQELLYIAGAYIAKQFGKFKKEKIFIVISSVIIASCIIVIWFLTNVIAIYILNLVISFLLQGIFVLLLQSFINDQKQKGYFQDSIFYRDVFQNFSRTLTCSIYTIGLFAPAMFIMGIIFSGGLCYTSLKSLKNTSTNTNKKQG